MRQIDKRLNLLPRLAECFLDGRNQKQVEHPIGEMLAQRVYGLALGYEDVNDHEQLRTDPVFGILAGRAELNEPLAGNSTLNRMELGTGITPADIVLDVDTTDLPLHGKQEGRFFHGDYDCYCYLPLYVFCGEHVLCARLRQASHDVAFGYVAEIERIVRQIRAAWPG